MRYRIPLEFEAENDDDARQRLTRLEPVGGDSVFGEPSFCKLITAELTRAETYWQKVDTK